MAPETPKQHRPRAKFCEILYTLKPSGPSANGRLLPKDFVILDISGFLSFVAHWHTTCISIVNFKQDWLPGVAGPEPRLGFRFWGVNYKEGGLHQPPFCISSLP
jgi:hypothetical protein